ncbi:hypothetical protein PpBr36_02304 [Pyricularia pennisetigena]|uniref:hypothetical protein n=1 Tax=Pyricularia pennisetigena TaxID=1578925 RepID=UPI0011537848|nr:hypothetical protein PpBr36_02304 [Pyricularia pennisetigena]TLS30363.1 hypothetical protein PpBr36_02304 [Pyricularia pennisetigena]
MPFPYTCYFSKIIIQIIQPNLMRNAYDTTGLKGNSQFKAIQQIRYDILVKRFFILTAGTTP